MKIITQESKLKCDLHACKNNADYSIVKEGACPKDYMNICRDCLKELYVQTGLLLVPKAIKHPMVGGRYKGDKNDK